MKTEHRLLLAALKCAVQGTPWVADSTPDWQELLQLAGRHQVAPLLQSVVCKMDGVPDYAARALQLVRQQAAFNEAQQHYVAETVGKQLTCAKIPHILLKGTVLKADYPAPELRTMSDLDVLVHQEDYSRVCKVMEPLGGVLVHSDGGHRSYSVPPGVKLEFHPNLIYVASSVGAGINPGWQYAEEGSGPYAMTLTEEGFYLHLICHLAGHFFSGGTGIRSVLDVWVYRHCHSPQPAPALIRGELERIGLWNFAQRIEALSEYWFGSGETTEALDELGQYILGSGTYGTMQQGTLNEACFAGSKTSATMGRIFLPMSDMRCRFTWLERAPFLLPVAWCIRAKRAITLHHKEIKGWTRCTAALSREEITNHQQWLKQIAGLETE
ncbi:MAG: nucleotidyltransferase family protein [Oscillospiraceae bacterium]